jgi:hypothetical protein
VLDQLGRNVAQDTGSGAGFRIDQLVKRAVERTVEREVERTV